METETYIIELAVATEATQGSQPTVTLDNGFSNVDDRFTVDE